MTTPQTSHLEALEARRDDLWHLLLEHGGDSADWAELERLNNTCREALLGDCFSTFAFPDLAIDHTACDEWLESPAARDYLPTAEE